MTVDIVSLTIFGFLAVLGWRSGAVRQILRVIAVIAVIVGAPFVSPVFRDILFGETGRASPGIEVMSILVAGILIYVTIALAGWAFIRVMRFVSATLSFFDRLGGAGLGALKAVVLIYLFAALVVFLEGPLVEHDPDNKLALRDGEVTEFVVEHNILAPWQFPDLERFHRALRVGSQIEDGESHALVREISAAADFLRDERVQTLLDDDDLMAFVDADHYPMTLADRRVRNVLNDPEIMEKLDAVDWRQLLQDIEEESGEGAEETQ